MKAIGFMEFGEPEVLQEIQVDMPVCGADQVLIHTEGVSINYADLQTRRGAFHGGGSNFPVIPGLDAAGTIVALGDNVTGLQVGQRVIAFPHTGSYAEYLVADSALVFPIPDEVSWDQAIACPLVGFTTRMLLEKVARIQPGEKLLVHAASGGIGSCAIQTARNLGAAKIIGTVGSPQKMQAALDAGADEVICLADGDFSAKVMELTDGKGVDVILDSLGGPYTPQGMSCLAPYGRMVVFGNASRSYSQLDTGLLHASCRSVLGFSIGASRRMRPSLFAEVAPAVLEDLRTGRLQVPIAAKFPFAEAAKAHKLLEDRTITGKIILRNEA